MARIGVLGVFLTLLFLRAAPAEAGRGATAGTIAGAIRSGSVEAIEAELERAEVLVCHACLQLVRPLVDHEDARVRRVAAWWLARRGLRPELSLEMVTRLSQPDSRRARNAADVLGEMRAWKSITPLGAALNNPIFDAEARAAMAHALGAIGDLDGLGALVTARDAAEAPVRAAALEAMRQLRGFQDPGAAVSGLGDAALEVRVAAIETVASTRTAAASSPVANDVVSTLVRLLGNDPSSVVRKKAAWALGEIRAPAATAGPALQRSASSDPDPFVRSLANAALGKLAP